jgi:leucine dehydrogenase
MTLKSSAAGLPLGGGKSVIVDGNAEPAKAMLDSFAEAIDHLGGRYIAAEDMGTTPTHMDRIATRTRWVAGRSTTNGGTGDPSPSTAQTVFGSIRAAAANRWGAEDLSGRTIGVLGVGKVGGGLAALAADAGAQLVVADLDEQRARSVAAALDAEVAPPRALLERSLDVLAPCGTGGLLSMQAASLLPVQIVCGGANNTLATDEVADCLAERGILYVPDFLANAGGIIHVGGEFLGWDSERIRECLEGCVKRVTSVLAEARSRRVTPLAVAYERARARLDASHVGAP